MNSVKARGQLQHHFHGNYWANIVLAFDSAEAASDAMVVLGEPWKNHSKESRALTWQGDSEALDIAKKQLVSFGAIEKNIDSIAKSIDYGEPFEIVVPVSPKEQLSLL